MRRCRALGLLLAALPAAAALWRSPQAVAFTPDGSTLAVADRTAGELVLCSLDGHNIRRGGGLVKPTALAFAADGRSVWVAEAGAFTVAQVEVASGRVSRRVQVGPRPCAVAALPRAGRLVVTTQADRAVTLLDPSASTPPRRLELQAEPSAVAVTPNEDVAVVCQLLPFGDATRPDQAAAVTLWDLDGGAATDIALPSGSTAVRDVAVSPDGRWAYITHVIGRYHLPTTQLDRGWMVTNAVSILDLAARERYATILLDQLYEGAADPWGVATSADGATLWVALSGVHQVARIDLAALHPLLAGVLAEDSPLRRTTPEYTATALNLWPQIADDPARRLALQDDLTALTSAGVLERLPLPGRGPRGLAVAPDGAVAVAEYFSGEVAVLPAAGQARSITLGPQPPAEQIRDGEAAFHDATLCFQHWLSCATCHPDARADGLNWDLLNDGIGNPKNTRSLLLSHATPPAMSLAVRADVSAASHAGFRYIYFREPQPGEVEAVLAYLRSLQPLDSPHRGPAADRGARQFADPKVGCAECHAGPHQTDLRRHDVGTRGPYDHESEFDTPTLTEVWRTAPYLHDGRAATISDLLTTYNPGDRHGVTSHLTPAQVADLAEYVLSL